jgi:hypothetical protein
METRKKSDLPALRREKLATTAKHPNNPKSLREPSRQPFFPDQFE